MLRTTWQDSYTLGIPEMDGEHRRLIELLTRLEDAMRQGQGNQALETVFDGMMSYAATHFGHEEELMRQGNFPEAEAHAAQHRAFTQRAFELRKSFQEGKRAVSLDVLSFLQTWLLQHIQGSDRQYVPFVRSR